MAKKTKLHAPPEPDSPVDRAAIIISDLLGSLWFLTAFALAIGFYALWNLSALPGLRPFDPAPFAVLDTILSTFAIFLSISVLISQRRQRRTEKIREQVEFEVNIRAENEITKVLEMLHEIQLKIGITKSDQDLEEMKQELDIDRLHREVKKKSD